MKYRSIFISDVHLGTKVSQATLLIDFLRDNECDHLYLVGDIIDGWAMSKNFYWPQTHNDVIQKLMRKARKDTKVIYLPGNHDEFLRSFGQHEFGNIQLVDQIMHRGRDDKLYLVMHGDQFDAVIKNMKWLSLVGTWAYDFSIHVNVIISKIRDVLRLPYWSLSAWAKYKVKKAVNFISDFESSLASYARSKGAQGMICGHIHHANIREVDGVIYMNCGDWCESCTALVEHEDGRFEIIYFLGGNPR